MPHRRLLPLALLLAACNTVDYDLAAVPFPVSASPASAPGRPFEVRTKSVLWLHGLFGRSTPDVAALLREAAGPAGSVAAFRVDSGSSFHDWFVTHLSLGLFRSKTVTIRGVALPQ